MADRILRPGTVLGGTYLIESRIGSGGGGIIYRARHIRLNTDVVVKQIKERVMGYLNSRYKDFYDIYVLSMKYEFSYEKLRKAVTETFENRGTHRTMDAVAFGDEFLNDPLHQTRWKAFLKKKKALVQVSLDETMGRIKDFVRPLLEGTERAQWKPDKGFWE